MTKPSYQRWNYFVLKLKVNVASPPPSPQKASEKLKGSLSPDFIRSQFPNEYKEIKGDAPVEVQIQRHLEKLGAQGWELIDISAVNSKLLFFFKRPDIVDAD